MENQENSSGLSNTLKFETVYEGTKQLKALPMNKKEYCDFRGWEAPASEDATEQGYVVMYLGDKPNLANYEGCVAWLPKDVFEKAYHPINSAENLPTENKDTAAPSTFMDRLLNEETELNFKIARLAEFLVAPAFQNIDKEQQRLLKIQHKIMLSYSECLNERIIQINNLPTKERVFTQAEIEHLQSDIHKITGDGDVMAEFNRLLGVGAA